MSESESENENKSESEETLNEGGKIEKYHGGFLGYILSVFNPMIWLGYGTKVYISTKIQDFLTQIYPSSFIPENDKVRFASKMGVALGIGLTINSVTNIIINLVPSPIQTGGAFVAQLFDTVHMQIATSVILSSILVVKYGKGIWNFLRKMTSSRKNIKDGLITVTAFMMLDIIQQIFGDVLKSYTKHFILKTVESISKGHTLATMVQIAKNTPGRLNELNSKPEMQLLSSWVNDTKTQITQHILNLKSKNATELISDIEKLDIKMPIPVCQSFIELTNHELMGHLNDKLDATEIKLKLSCENMLSEHKQSILKEQNIPFEINEEYKNIIDSSCGSNFEFKVEEKIILAEARQLRKEGRHLQSALTTGLWSMKRLLLGDIKEPSIKEPSIKEPPAKKPSIQKPSIQKPSIELPTEIPFHKLSYPMKLVLIKIWQDTSKVPTQALINSIFAFDTTNLVICVIGLSIGIFSIWNWFRKNNNHGIAIEIAKAMAIDINGVEIQSNVISQMFKDPMNAEIMFSSLPEKLQQKINNNRIIDNIRKVLTEAQKIIPKQKQSDFVNFLTKFQENEVDLNIDLDMYDLYKRYIEKIQEMNQVILSDIFRKKSTDTNYKQSKLQQIQEKSTERLIEEYKFQNNNFIKQLVCKDAYQLFRCISNAVLYDQTEYIPLYQSPIQDDVSHMLRMAIKDYSIQNKQEVEQIIQTLSTNYKYDDWLIDVNNRNKYLNHKIVLSILVKSKPFQEIFKNKTIKLFYEKNNMEIYFNEKETNEYINILWNGKKEEKSEYSVLLPRNAKINKTTPVELKEEERKDALEFILNSKCDDIQKRYENEIKGHTKMASLVVTTLTDELQLNEDDPKMVKVLNKLNLCPPILEQTSRPFYKWFGLGGHSNDSIDIQNYIALNYFQNII